MENEDLLNDAFKLIKRCQDTITSYENYKIVAEKRMKAEEELIASLEVVNQNLRNELATLYQKMAKIGKN